MTGLEVGGVAHGYGVGARRVEVLHDVSLAVRPGELVALAGPSGSGKSTVCHLAAGIEHPERGTVTLDGRPTAELADWGEIAAVPQQHGLLAGLTVRDNVCLPAHRAGVDPTETFAWLAEALDLDAFVGRGVTDTSLGEQQRVAVARALVLSPRLAVLDEPTGHQDDDHVTQVVAALASAARAGTAVLVATHDSRVWEVADRVVRLDEGRIAPDPAPDPV
ncbi:ATP-binding cassette domain-containing protein [Nocardioides sp. MAH-18]|uniref:ATP-binding cassette domain-containing protein n=1 Tax=Nocardioides agri TaxID=2682843 RepID=A0A6L6Y045_9ACTN|nr:ABC transporter ATP-binding protein [Nocardioides sp. CGMCC 1.13656]MBA2956109.1 ABC transporter ATP-binding protein [Nocardioides sp. CGMCC 1.13656]MVQ50955.1 ATP-binding cassette domain-containing protein [Nocardioides sp. MAH-18]